MIDEEDNKQLQKIQDAISRSKRSLKLLLNVLDWLSMDWDHCELFDYHNNISSNYCFLFMEFWFHLVYIIIYDDKNEWNQKHNNPNVLRNVENHHYNMPMTGERCMVPIETNKKSHIFLVELFFDFLWKKIHDFFYLEKKFRSTWNFCSTS